MPSTGVSGMAEEDTPRRTSPGPGRLTPEEVANRTFSHQFRGISDTEVRNYLRRVSDELLRMRTTETDLRGRVEALEGQIKNPPPPTEQQLLVSLGEETARVLRSANEAAEEIRSKAEARAGLLVSEAQVESDRLREESAELLADRTRDAEAVASELRAAAETDAARVVELAASDAERVRTAAADAAAAELEAAKTAGREMVTESRALRDRVLGDLDKRRELLQAQVDELRRGRDRLLDAYRVVKDTLGSATEALAQVEFRASSELGHFETTGPQPIVTVEADLGMFDDEISADATGAVLDPNASGRADARDEAGASGSDGDAPAPDHPGEASEPDSNVAPGPVSKSPASPAIGIVVGEVAERVRIIEEPAGPGVPTAGVASEPAPAADSTGLAAEAVAQAAAPARRPGLRGYLRSTLGYEPDPEAAETAEPLPATEEQPTSERSTLESSTLESPTLESSTLESSTTQATEESRPSAEPALAEPTPVEPALDESAAVEPTPVEPTAVEPTAVEPTPVESTADAADESGEPRDVGALFARLRADTATTVTEEPPASGPEGSAGSAVEGSPPETSVADAPGTTESVVLQEVTIDGLTVVVTADTADTEGSDAVDDARAAEAESRPVQARAARDLALTKVGRDLARRAKRTLQDDQNALLDALRTQRGRPVAAKVLPPVEEQIELWTTVLSDAVHAAFAAGYATVDDPADSELPVGLAAELAEALVVPLRERLVPAISGDSSEPDEDDDVAGRVSARFREWKNQNLENALGDGLAVAYARGVYEAAPAGALLEWVPAVVGRCPDCDDNALEPTVRGQCFPTGQPFPPAHPGCRCLLMVAMSTPLVRVDAGRSADR
ncbi:MAG: DivIVA domain [Actinomycetia bacterium]|nr:DivIVA domain [Actinomycetes bacterium]